MARRSKPQRGRANGWTSAALWALASVLRTTPGFPPGCAGLQPTLPGDSYQNLLRVLSEPIPQLAVKTPPQASCTQTHCELRTAKCKLNKTTPKLFWSRLIERNTHRRQRICVISVQQLLADLHFAICILHFALSPSRHSIVKNQDGDFQCSSLPLKPLERSK